MSGATTMKPRKDSTKKKAPINVPKETNLPDDRVILDTLYKHYATPEFNEDGVLEKDYQGKLYDLFDGNRELVKILFDYINKPKGYWMCKVQYWFDLDKS